MSQNSRHRPKFRSLRIRLFIILFSAAAVTVWKQQLIVQPVQALSSDIVISQLYGGGGNAGSTFRNDFIELFNRGAAPVSVNGWSVQYASAAGTTWAVTNLTNVTIQPGQYYLVQEAQGAGGTTNLPTPDATGTIAMSATAGKVALVNNTTALTCGASNNCLPNANIIDFVGFGATAASFEGTGPTPAPSNTTAVLRGTNGCTETDQNATDFAAGTPNPRNTATTLAPCGGPPVLTLNIGDVSLAEGNAGTTSFNFTVSLSGGTAPAGGVSFDASTADGTTNPANAPGDYTALVSQPGSISAGNTSTTVTATVNGDLTTEANETFFVNISNVTNATAGDVQGLGTITNDDFTLTPIHTIQGSGSTSPLAGNAVTTSGIVTGLRSNGFFIQEPDASVDADPNTSEGIFVFTSSAPPATAAIGNSVTVGGTVQEFVPSADPFSPPATELITPPWACFHQAIPFLLPS